LVGNPVEAGGALGSVGDPVAVGRALVEEPAMVMV